MKTARLKEAIASTAAFLIAIWVVHFFNFLSGMRLSSFGIHPLHLDGLIGIAAAPSCIQTLGTSWRTLQSR